MVSQSYDEAIISKVNPYRISVSQMTTTRDSTFLITYHRNFTQRVPLVEQKRHTIYEQLNSPPVFSGVCLAQS
jgi:hypothetical protein